MSPSIAKGYAKALAALLAAAVLCLLAACDDGKPAASGAGYAGLGGEASAYAQVQRGKPLSFPADHGPHDGYRIEWWYVTADLRDEDGHDWGVQWTLFRSALRPGADQAGWESADVWMAHAALTDAAGHQFAEKLARGGIGQAGVQAVPFRAWIDDWSLQGPDMDSLTMQANGTDFGYRLSLRSQGPLVLHGDAGYSEKSGEGQASYYYSQPFYKVSGEIERAGKRHRVQGRAWLDREWSSQPLSADQQGWDWFSLHLADGAKLMLFQVRQKHGAPYRAGTWIAANGSVTPLRSQQISLDPLEWTRQDDGRELPTRWRVRVAGLPAGPVDVTAAAVQPRAWMATSFPYWEGPVRLANGGGQPGGTGYLEMTGY
ncbi:iron ABC transporter permease [Bordetella genomosp. 9]|uniref:Iron ABC transporter permease n=1 Tax=Bordetella genomosp. 9 TaxID=1416803 RepID=A0A261R3E4_9BORD|nr:lipocalin-like domain-containing protein [Bordetella genomosp. 9]OZI19162.1 iron ABC transporter permease [Bordetella genomosp. 9]